MDRNEMNELLGLTEQEQDEIAFAYENDLWDEGHLGQVIECDGCMASWDALPEGECRVSEDAPLGETACDAGAGISGEDARAKLLSHILLAEAEIANGSADDYAEFSQSVRTRYGL